LKPKSVRTPAHSSVRQRKAPVKAASVQHRKRSGKLASASSRKRVHVASSTKRVNAVRRSPTQVAAAPKPANASQGQVISVTPDQLADRDMVRRGDAYLLNLTACPRLVYRHESMGTAVTFGQIDEVIDTVRCRLAFGLLPSA
jgi:hypothetical protein